MRATSKTQFPVISDLAFRLCVMGTQSADVERVCKVHKLVHTKARNRLKNLNVCRLLFCYVNLRLLKSLEKPGSIDNNNDMEDFLSQAALLNTDEDANHGCDTDELDDETEDN